ncbi:hypothetical protein MJT46_004840 [Ovis ammon polii x Ovis aries]|nr:hypothetical protein MJT46_004840 [Ovis ammon polii x Ovis aries]
MWESGVTRSSYPEVRCSAACPVGSLGGQPNVGPCLQLDWSTTSSRGKGKHLEPDSFTNDRQMDVAESMNECTCPKCAT